MPLVRPPCEPPAGSRLLDLLEPGWRRHLVSGEPAGTIDVERQVLDAAATALGSLSRSGPPAELSRRWPACVVVAMAQVTAHYDTTGKVWPAWHRAAGTRPGKHSTADWAGAFLGSLAALGLPARADDPRDMVLAHAAVTTSSLPEFLRLAGARMPDRDLARADPAAAALLRQAAPPHQGPSAGFAGRCRALMELLIGDGEPDAGDLAGLSLPRRVIDAGRAAASQSRLGGWPPRRLDPFGQGVLARDAGTDGGPSDAWSWTATVPEEVADPADPLLAFDAGGEPITAALPPEAVWLVFPQDRPLRADTTPRVLVESTLPLTWKGWRLVQVDLSAVAWLELAPPAGEEPQRHPVRGVPKPRLVAGPGVPGTRTANGLAVHGTPPVVWLPAGDVQWRVEVRRAGSGPVLVAAEATGDNWDPRCPWDQMPRPVLGELVVTVTAQGGALANGLRRVVAVAEGLAASYSPALRLLCEEGLEAAEAVLIPPPGMTVSPCAAAIPAGVTGVEVACVSGPAVLPLRVIPPHCRIRIEPEPGSRDAATAWHSLGPLRLTAGDLARGGALRLDLPGARGNPPLEVVAGGEVVQVIEPGKRGGYPLRRMLDTVIAHGGAGLRITLGARTAVVARIGAPAPVTDPWLPG
jgi:hypothetical protein